MTGRRDAERAADRRSWLAFEAELFRHAPLEWTVLTAGFAPFLVLASYVVRLTVVARRTADTFPFSSQLRSTVGLDEGPPGQR